MLNKARKRAYVAFIVMALVAATAAPVYADDAVGGVDCSQDPGAPECDVSAGTPAKPGNNGGGSRDQSGGSSGEPSNCFYERVRPQAPPPAGAGAGAWYTRTCRLDGGGSSQTQPIWLTDVPPPDPAVLAQQAVSRLRLPAPAIHTNPDAGQTDFLVWVPVWLWVGGSSWASRSATASVPGMTVTATATAKKTVWHHGDNTSQICGQGTAWQPGTDPRRASPNCGHTYTQAGTLTLTATVTWGVAWRGGGQSGTVPDLATTANLTVRVVEAAALNTARWSEPAVSSTQKPRTTRTWQISRSGDGELDTRRASTTSDTTPQVLKAGALNPNGGAS